MVVGVRGLTLWFADPNCLLFVVVELKKNTLIIRVRIMCLFEPVVLLVLGLGLGLVLG